MKAVKVAIADARGSGETLAAILAENPRIEVVTTARSGAECIRKVALTRPHVLVLSLAFRDMEASEIIDELAARELRVAVYIVGPDAAKENVKLQMALKKGAFDFLKCGGTKEELNTLKRQITNTIFVAALSATKQIPLKEGTRSPSDLKGLVEGKTLVIVSWGAERVGELAEIFARLKIGPQSDVLAVVGIQPEEFERTMSDLGDLVRNQARPVTNGIELTGGSLYATPRRVQDIVVEKSPQGKPTLAFIERRSTKEVGPNLDRLFTTAAQKLGKWLAVAMVGGDGTDGAKGLKAVADAGGVTLVDDLSMELLAVLKKEFPDGSIPRRVAPLEDLRILLKELE